VHAAARGSRGTGARAAAAVSAPRQAWASVPHVLVILVRPPARWRAGRSFHSVQEVFVSEKPRMSISGWYHADAEHVDAHLASLKQLQMRAGQDNEGVSHTPVEGALAARGGHPLRWPLVEWTSKDVRMARLAAQRRPQAPSPCVQPRSPTLAPSRSEGASWMGQGPAYPGSPFSLAGHPFRTCPAHICHPSHAACAVQRAARPCVPCTRRRCVPAGGGGPLSDDDLSLLVRWVDPTYLSEAAWPRVRVKFAEDGSVQLKGFLKKGLAQKVGPARGPRRLFGVVPWPVPFRQQPATQLGVAAILTASPGKWSGPPVMAMAVPVPACLPADPGSSRAGGRLGRRRRWQGPRVRGGGAGRLGTRG
jgi:hypothetical protein